jgi:hypothetical protein
MAKSTRATCTGTEGVDPRTVITVEEMTAMHGATAGDAYARYGAYGRNVCTTCGNIVGHNASGSLRKHVMKKWNGK